MDHQKRKEREGRNLPKTLETVLKFDYIQIKRKEAHSINGLEQ
jgi:hypothetical protein